MLTQLRCPIRLSFSSTDGLITSDVETVGTLYQKDCDRYHLLLTEPLVTEWNLLFQAFDLSTTVIPTPRLLWFEFSPYRVAITMQGNGQFSYRHLFAPGVFGTTRYWLQASANPSEQFCLRNFTRNLHVKGNPLPCYLLLEYELWADQLKLGDYTLSLDIQH
ncbi:hypothetical protein OsccyDRAFT_0054 [Leptolyngbyaceae cyanobacterium JSC-12]|nr:hypothetical protein OsccyDRAFT_0054 [Leptolyngbyaceae cyanobacterium JSC-12]